MICLPLPFCARSSLWLVAAFLLAVSAQGIATDTAATSGTASKLVCSPCAVDFGTVKVGRVRSADVVFTNSGKTDIKITSKTKRAPWVSPLGLPLPYTLKAGKQVAFQLVYAPQDDRPASGHFIYQSNAANGSVRIRVSANASTAGILTATPSPQNFGSVQVGQTVSKYETLTNASTANIEVTRVTASGSYFSIGGISLPVTLSPGHSVTFATTFAPQAAGSFSGSISVASSANNSTLAIAESGTATSSGSLGLSPATINFGSVPVGSTKTLGATLTANGASVTVKSGSLSSNEYSISGLSLPLKLSAGQSVNFKVTFGPQSSGTANATLSFATGTSNPAAKASLQGSGASGTQHSVKLTWKASASKVSGYNVYRGTKSGGPYSLITSALDSGTSYNDTSVQAGVTYYYVVTAVNGKGQESVDSNQAKAAVP